MALQGTVESFPVIEVVRLLADGGHTGRLTVDGDRGSAVMWVADGSLLGGELGNTHQLDPVRLVTEALRHRTGVFSFDVMPLGADVSAGMWTMFPISSPAQIPPNSSTAREITLRPFVAPE